MLEKEDTMDVLDNPTPRADEIKDENNLINLDHLSSQIKTFFDGIFRSFIRSIEF